MPSFLSSRPVRSHLSILTAALALLSLSNPSAAAQDVEPVSPAVIFPQVRTPTVEPDPIPVQPDAVPALTSGQLYIAESDTQFFLLAFPRGLVNVTYETGPIKIRGLFADGTGKVETRTYDSPFVAIVDAAEGKSGRVELAGVPVGLSSEKDIVRQLIDIGAGPRPPPGPVDPSPKPPEPPQPDQTDVPQGFRVLMIYESSANMTREQLNILHSTQITAYLTSKCVKGPNSVPEWRKWDKDVTFAASESPTMKQMFEAAKPKLGPLPQLAIHANGKGVILDFPATEAEMLALLKKYGGE